MENNYITPQFLAEHIADMIEDTNINVLGCIVDPEKQDCFMLALNGGMERSIDPDTMETMFTAIAAGFVRGFIQVGTDPTDIVHTFYHVLDVALDAKTQEAISEDINAASD